MSLDGSQCLKETRSVDITAPCKGSDNYMITKSMVLIDASIEKAVLTAEDIGSEVAKALMQKGASELLKQAREEIALAQNDLRLPISK